MLIERFLNKDQSIFARDKDLRAYTDLAAFCRVSTSANPVQYLRYANATLGAVLPRHECESQDDYLARVQRTPVRPYVRQVLNKYLGAAFRNWPTFAEDVTTERQYAIVNLAKQLFASLFVTGSCFVAVVDDDIRFFDAEHLIHAEPETASYLVQQGDHYVLLSPGALVRFTKDFEILESSEAVILAQFATTPLAAPLAVQARAIHQLLSLQAQEITDAVFTKFVLSGADLQLDDERQKIQWSTKRLMVLPSADAKLHTVGSDPHAAQTIAQAIETAERQLFESAGIVQLPSSSLSGVTVQLLREDFFGFVGSLLDDVEQQVQLLEPSVVFSRRFVVDDELTILKAVQDVWNSALPLSFKQFVLRNYLNKYTNLDTEEIESLIQS